MKKGVAANRDFLPYLQSKDSLRHEGLGDCNHHGCLSALFVAIQ
jgi:hypothetical protein